MTTEGDPADGPGDSTDSDGRENSTDEYADLGATTADAMEIAETSMDRVRELVPDETLADRVRQKSVHATGDPEFQYLVRFTSGAAEAQAGATEDDASAGDESADADASPGRDARDGLSIADRAADDSRPDPVPADDVPVRAGARAVLDERPIVTDITMVKEGITGRGHDCEVRKAIGNGAELAAETGMTRTAASVLELDREGVYDGAIAVVGNAPTAALALADCVEQGTRPAAIVATPVGFVKAARSRERLREVAAEHGVPAITTVGRRGGSGLAAGLTNELIHVASDARDGEVDLAPPGEQRVATDGGP